MSSQFRAQSADDVDKLLAELTQAQSVNANLAILNTALMEYFGPFPKGLDGRLATMARAKADRVVPPTLESVLDDVRAIVRTYKHDVELGRA